MWVANAKKCLTNSYMASRNQTAKHYGSMSSDRKSYLPRQRTLIVVLCNIKAIKIGSLKHSLVEELFTHHHHRSGNCWLQRTDLRSIDLLQFPLQICIQKEKHEIDLMSCLRIEVQLLKDLQMKTILVKESIPSMLCFVEFQHWNAVDADDHRYACEAGLSQLLKLLQRSLPGTYRSEDQHHQIHA